MQTRRKRISMTKKNIVSTKDAGASNDNCVSEELQTLQSTVSGNTGYSISTTADNTMGNEKNYNTHCSFINDDRGGSDVTTKSSSVHSFQPDDLTAADKIDVQLLILEDNERSQVMHKLVTGFQQKVQACFDSFSPDLALSCLRIVTSVSALKPVSKTPHKSKDPSTVGERAGSREFRSLTPNDPFSELDYNDAMTRELPNFTVSRLRTTVQQILRRATLRQDGSLYFSGASQTAMATKSVQYFIWYFEFKEYLQELHVNFVERIFTPMFKYFHDFNLLGSNGRTTTMSSVFSKFSQFGDGSLSDDEQEGDGNVDETAQMRSQAKTSLKCLSNEYKDIKSIYDTSEIDKIAQRLSLLKEQIDTLLDEEDEVDPELYSSESGKMIQHLNIDYGTENLLRLVPDILVKLRKAAWLVCRWLQLDDQRTKDAREKLEKIATIEEQLTKRLDILQKDVFRDEQMLEKETDELNLLMEREARSEKMNVKTYNLDGKINIVQKEIAMLKRERDSFSPKLAEIVKSKNIREYHKLKFRFESNKLQRFVLERKFASLNYQRNLLADDLKLELLIKPSVIHSSNKLQDDCESLEKVIREQKEKMSTIKNALIPIKEDKTSLINRVNRQLESEASSTKDRRHLSPVQGNAVHVRSVPTKQLRRASSLRQLSKDKSPDQHDAMYLRTFFSHGTLNTPLPVNTPLPLKSQLPPYTPLPLNTPLPVNSPLPSIPNSHRHPIERSTMGTKSRPGPSVQSRTFLLRRIPVVGNNRAARTISPPTW